ncbi:hypothetical protein [Tahibacter amnicola]|uniref:Uncharacterized protein n=1 Tax=Tahibacter amnicola TaxID=2976241 RepID=A0ABY6BK17_9GAMM|nr:hypothetical protein [Tahibacter amnicola]UXI69425.1 hypothetical protein N4264_07185 [Tahibacter amnicola]
MARSYGQGTVTVWNPVNGDVHKYRSQCGNPRPGEAADKAFDVGPDGVRGSCPALLTDEITLEPVHHQVTRALSEIYRATNGSYRTTFDVDLTGQTFDGYSPRPPSIYDFVHDMPLQSRINSLLNNSDSLWSLVRSPLASAFHLALSHADAAMGYSDGVHATFTVYFADGSSVTATQDFDLPVEIQMNTAKDSTGHPIPLSNSAGGEGHWVYSSNSPAGSLGQLLNQLGSLGIPITGQYNGGNSGTVRCRWTPASNTLICTIGP